MIDVCCVTNIEVLKYYVDELETLINCLEKLKTRKFKNTKEELIQDLRIDLNNLNELIKKLEKKR
ncbi:MAG TPA: hypothetical protein ENF87_01420 [Thermoproteales archaeon]|nr:hypothetical protein [Thermoproteales archaeon]